jgi:hypothetical protein
VRDYRVQFHDGSRYQDLLSVQGNYQRRRIHHFEPVVTRKVRVLVEATNGARAARVYEIRLYEGGLA